MEDKLNVIRYNASLQKLAFTFCSGNPYLDQFIKSPLSLDNNFGTTYVLLSEDQNIIIGYYNICMGYIEQIDYGNRKKLGGAVHINCFALDEKFHGLLQIETNNGVKVNLSDVMLWDCLDRIEKIRLERIGFAFITLCSTEEGYSLYERNGFLDLEDDMSFSVEESDVKCKLMYMTVEFEEI